MIWFFFPERIVIYLTWNHKWEKNCDAIYHNNTTIVHVHSTRYHLCFGGSRDQTIMPRAHLHNLVQTQFLPTMTTVSWSIERSAVPDILGNPVLVPWLRTAGIHYKGSRKSSFWPHPSRLPLLPVWNVLLHFCCAVRKYVKKKF